MRSNGSQRNGRTDHEGSDSHGYSLGRRYYNCSQIRWFGSQLDAWRSGSCAALRRRNATGSAPPNRGPPFPAPRWLVGEGHDCATNRVRGHARLFGAALGRGGMRRERHGRVARFAASRYGRLRTQERPSLSLTPYNVCGFPGVDELVYQLMDCFYPCLPELSRWDQQNAFGAPRGRSANDCWIAFQ